VFLKLDLSHWDPMANFWEGAFHRAVSQIISRSSMGSFGKRVNSVRGGNWDISESEVVRNNFLGGMVGLK